MLAIALLASLAAANAFVAPPPAASCDTQQFAGCVAAFGDAIQIQLTADSDEFQKELQKAFMRGPDFFKTLCGAVHNLPTCMKTRDAYDACVNVASLQAQGLAAKDAYAYAALAATFEAECSEPVYSDFLKNMGCLGNVYVNHTLEYRTCVETFKQNAAADYPRFCTYAQQYLNCLGAVYAGNCPKPIGFDVCSITKAGVSTAKDCKDLSCDMFKMQG